jgi:protoporphyrinogen oxidase
MDTAVKTRIGIVGGGLMGLALARELAVRGNIVDVFEREQQLGGLATHHDYGNFSWDRFYHVILPTDRHLIEFVQAIGLESELRWQRTYTGFYVDERLHSISSALEFLKFPLLSIVDKVRLAWTLLYCSRIDDWQSLERIPVDEWLMRVSGKNTYEKLWRPLLLAKLGESYQRVSAVFIWSYIKRLFSARAGSASKEQLGHVTGGYKMIFERLRSIISSTGGSIRTGVTVSSISPGADSSINIDILEDEESWQYDKVICTSPVPVLERITHPSLLSIREGAAPVEYLGVVCVVVVTNVPVVPYYVVNIADASIPFTGISGMSSVVDSKYTQGEYITYLPKYVLSTDA